MAKESKQPETLPSPVTAEPALSSCGRKGESEGANFVQDIRARFGKFIQAPMVEHKQCFKDTVQKMTNKIKIGVDKKSETKEVESLQTLQTTAPK